MMIENDIIVYGCRMRIKWLGEGFNNCNDILITPEKPGPTVMFSLSERLPVIVAILYS